MACCGQRRAQLSLNGQVASGGNRIMAAPTPMAMFEYTGETAMTAVGGVTGQSYYFRQRGARVQVDARDVRSLAGLPNLTYVR